MDMSNFTVYSVLRSHGKKSNHSQKQIQYRGNSMFEKYINKKIRSDYAAILRKELYPGTYWECGSDFLKVEVTGIDDVDVDWYLFVLHIIKKPYGRTILGTEMEVIETDGITFSESAKKATDLFDKEDIADGMKEAERVLGLIIQ